MNDGQAMTNHSAVEIVPSLMIPLATDILLLPTVTVAEIVPQEVPEVIAGSPDWLLGYFHWRDQRVPLMSLEILRGGARSQQHATSRIVVLNNTGVSQDLPFIAIVADGIPKLAHVGAEDLGVSPNSPGAFENMRVMLNGEEAVIPEVSSLERVFLDWQASQ